MLPSTDAVSDLFSKFSVEYMFLLAKYFRAVSTSVTREVGSSLGDNVELLFLVLGCEFAGIFALLAPGVDIFGLVL